MSEVNELGQPISQYEAGFRDGRKSLETQVATLTAELRRCGKDNCFGYREALAGIVARFTLRDGRCSECGIIGDCNPGCEIGAARELLKEETK